VRRNVFLAAPYRTKYGNPVPLPRLCAAQAKYHVTREKASKSIHESIHGTGTHLAFIQVKTVTILANPCLTLYHWLAGPSGEARNTKKMDCHARSRAPLDLWRRVISYYTCGKYPPSQRQGFKLPSQALTFENWHLTFKWEKGKLLSECLAWLTLIRVTWSHERTKGHVTWWRGRLGKPKRT